ncbi:ATP-binding protein [Flavobacterium sp. MFBS3-15]|uniref:sensor histidine kinase n=1 Tax=Flavobacterium sp. MFBS3-15 TaxID=2989816 RepID=UPI002236BB30|nr:ATP-binding protein [Flavobacterium sp. MFBS3-15]MCW4468078.1 ATP-binding protein [Flavobacterium sp. MFBS3-15]
MKQYLHIILLLVSLCVYPQDKMPPALEIANDTAVSIPFPKSRLQYFTEKGKPLSLQEVLKPGKQSAFQSLTDSSNVEILPGEAFWIRYRIKNATGKPLGITIPESVGHATVYIAGPDGSWSHFETGTQIAHSKRDGYKRIMHIPYTIPANSVVTVYERNFERMYKVSVNVSIGIDRNVVREAYVENDSYITNIIIASGLFGFFLFAAIFNLFFFYTVREKVYLMYGLLLIFLALDVFSWPLVTIIFKEYPGFRIIDSFIGSTVNFTLFTLVSLRFMQASKHYPLWNRILIGSAIVFFMVSAYRYFITDLSSDALGTVIWWIRFCVVMGIMVILVIGLVRKQRFAIMLALAMIPFLIVFILMLTHIADYPWLINCSFIWAILVLSWSLFQRYKHLQQENARQALEKEQERNEMIARQNELLEHQVAERTSELTQSLAELKQTQSQLIQSEKMASLGELTAGIAHEIQNPLNFVNNFSDVSIELLDEMDEELDKGDVEEAKAIAGDIKQNLEKINHHGRRADSIVKGMLQHSRASSGQKEPTDINLLADEYLRLAYHGLRAKDKSFNAELVTQFDENLPKVKVIPQDLGRVLLNLFTNAFYATQEKKKSPPTSKGGDAGLYKPTVEVVTRQVGNSIEISVKDNGTGIPDAIKDKILQPFFTTKPTGEGTGLGLSLSYDIVVKGHGGHITIESEEQVFTTFTITIPLAE